MTNFTPTAGRTLEADVGSARGNDAASRTGNGSLPKAANTAPEEHGSSAVHPQSLDGCEFCEDCQKLKPCCCG